MLIDKINDFIKSDNEVKYIIKSPKEINTRKICEISSRYLIDNKCGFGYNNNGIYLFKLSKEIDMLFEVPYKNRSKYYKLIHMINNVISVDGVVVFAVYNDPLNGSRAYLSLENITKEETEEIQKLNNGVLKEKYGKTYSNFFEDMIKRKCNIASLLPESDFDYLKLQLEHLFLFPEEEVYNANGYELSYKEVKVFISYCHKDSSFVDGLEKYLSDKEIQVWYDKKDIDYGENILEKMSEGMKSSDIGLLILSNSYKSSLYGNHELNTFFNSQIQKSKDLIPIKIDNVVPDEILFGLSNLKYLEVETNQTNIDVYEKIYEAILIKSEKYNL